MAVPYQLYKRTLASYEKACGEESRRNAEALFHFAIFYSQQGLFSKAEPILIKLMELSEKEINVSELEKADYFRLYANVLTDMGRVAEAEPLFARAEAIFAEKDAQDDDW